MRRTADRQFAGSKGPAPFGGISKNDYIVYAENMQGITIATLAISCAAMLISLYTLYRVLTK